MEEYVTKDSKTAAYLIYKGKELLKMRKDDVGDSEFLFNEDDDLEDLAREFPLTPLKRYLDIYKAVVKATKEA